MFLVYSTRILKLYTIAKQFVQLEILILLIITARNSFLSSYGELETKILHNSKTISTARYPLSFAVLVN